MNRFQPLNDFVLVRPDCTEKMTDGGLVIPDMAQEKARTGEVLACGPGRWEYGRLCALDVKVGQQVRFGRYTGVDITIDDQPLLVMREEEILGFVPPPANTIAGIPVVLDATASPDWITMHPVLWNKVTFRISYKEEITSESAGSSTGSQPQQ